MKDGDISAHTNWSRICPNPERIIFLPNDYILKQRRIIWSPDNWAITLYIIRLHSIGGSYMATGQCEYEQSGPLNFTAKGLLTDTWNCWLRMRRECRERFPRHRLKKKTLYSNPDKHRCTCVTYVPWCMSGSLTSVAGKSSRLSGRMRKPHFCVSGKRPMVETCRAQTERKNPKYLCMERKI